MSCLAFACVLPALVAEGGLITHAYLRERAMTAESAIIAARTLIQVIDSELVLTETTLQVLATARTLEVGDLANFHVRIADVLPFSGASNIVLSDLSGQQLLSTLKPFGATLPHLGNMDALRRVIATGKPVVSGQFSAPIAQTDIATVDVPVFAHGKLVAVLAAGIASQRVYDIIRRQGAPRTWIITIRDSAGDLVARTLNVRKYIGVKPRPPMLQLLEAGVEEDSFSQKSLDGINVFTVFSRSPVLGWIAVISIPKTVLTADLRRDLGLSMAAAGILLAIGATVTLMVSQLIVRSIRALAGPALALAEASPVSVQPVAVSEVAQIGIALADAARLMEQTAIDREKMEATERRIEEAERTVVRLNAIMDAVPDAMIKVDRDGYITRVNGRAESLFGYQRQELLGQPVGCLLATRLQTGQPGDMGRLLANTQQGTDGPPLCCRRRDGSEFPVDVSVSRLELDGESFVMIDIRDITDRRRLEAEVEAGHAQVVASARLASLGTMAGGIAHEINNPLAVIHALADDLVDCAELGDLPSAQVAHCAQRITRLAERIAKIIKSLRYLARDGATDRFVATSLGDIVLLALDVCEQRFRDHAVALEIRSIDSAPRIPCREVQISQIVVNLLQNAFDAAQESDGEHWVRLDVGSDDTYATLTIIDSGKGVAPGLRQRIMEPFFTTKPLGKGTGLGLSLSVQAAEQHGGKIELTESGGHTCFTLYLPLQHQENRT